VIHEIFRLGHQEDRQESRQAGLLENQQVGRQAEAAALSLRQLQRRCCTLRSAPQTTASRPFHRAISKPGPTLGSMSKGPTTAIPDRAASARQMRCKSAYASNVEQENRHHLEAVCN